MKRSSLHSPNSPDSPSLQNLHISCHTRLSRVWRVLAKWFGECGRVWQVTCASLSLVSYSNLMNKGNFVNHGDCGNFGKGRLDHFIEKKMCT